MNDMSISSLYRRLVANRPRPDLDPADLVDAVSADPDRTGLPAARHAAVADALASSAGHAGLARMLRALRPASAELAERVNERRRVAHPLRDRHARPAAPARRIHVRRLRWAGAAAACLAVVLGLWSSQHAAVRTGDRVAAVRAAPLPDRIFTSRDRIFAWSSDTHAGHRGGDEVFHGGFASGG